MARFAQGVDEFQNRFHRLIELFSHQPKKDPWAIVGLDGLTGYVHFALQQFRSTQCLFGVKTRIPHERSHVSFGQLRTNRPMRSILPCAKRRFEQVQQSG